METVKEGPLAGNMKFISADDSRLQYCGRIDDRDAKAPVLVYAASSVKLRFRGRRLAVRLMNRHSYFINSMGYLLDGMRGRFDLMDDGAEHTYVIAWDVPEGEHEILLYKRQDACHYVVLTGFELDGDGELLTPTALPSRRMEVFGDSVSCGEVCEAIDHVGQSDPENHNGIYSDSYYSYSWIAARKLGARLHDTSQGGMALLNGTGWFNGPDYVGAESCFDKVEYNPSLGETVPWDFKRFTPQLVVVALGQNDSNPEDYMAADPSGERAQNWKMRYRQWLEKLMDIYPKAVFVLTTTILGHDASWDRAIDEVARELDSPRVSHFLYSENGCGTSGHIRIPEAERMAEELCAYVETLGIDW